MSKKITTEDFIENARKVHGDKYDYSLTNYISAKTKVKIICPVHGVFEQTPCGHLSGRGCKKCSGKNKLTTEEFIDQARKVHGDKYDYSVTNYVNAKKEVKIICPIHGIFEQLPYNHLRGHGCSECATNLKSNTERFIDQARKVHGDKYDYSVTKYINSDKNVKIICPIHGVFHQKAKSHLAGHGCKKCQTEKIKKLLGRNKEEFINQARKVHGDKYDYSLVNYVNCRTKVKIICPIHGVFEQTPQSHLKGNGCKYCKNYSAEKDIYTLLDKLNIKYKREKMFRWLIYDRMMRLDIYIPKYKVTIECQGKQHFYPVEYFGGKEAYIETVNRDKKKRELCEQHGIKIFYYANYKYKFPYKVYTDPEELINDIMKIDPV